jgi:plasmid maintenance system antidote protein VapI
MIEPTFVFHPWEFLSDELEARGRSQKNFSYILWISPAYLNEIIKGKKNLTPELCIRIWDAFWTTANVRWNLQSEYSLITAKQTEEKNWNENKKSVQQRIKDCWYELIIQENEDEEEEEQYEEQEEQTIPSTIFEKTFA